MEDAYVVNLECGLTSAFCPRCPSFERADGAGARRASRHHHQAGRREEICGSPAHLQSESERATHVRASFALFAIQLFLYADARYCDILNSTLTLVVQKVESFIGKYVVSTRQHRFVLH